MTHESKRYCKRAEQKRLLWGLLLSLLVLLHSGVGLLPHYHTTTPREGTHLSIATTGHDHNYCAICSIAGTTFAPTALKTAQETLLPFAILYYCTLTEQCVESHIALPSLRAPPCLLNDRIR